MDVTAATVADALDVETVRLRGWRAAYRGIVPQDYLDAMVVDEPRRASLIAEGTVTTLVAREDGTTIGMAAHGPSRDGLGAQELYALYVDPDRWRTGAGSALLEACEDVSVLWVLEGNARAQAFYRRHGFEADGGSQVLDIGGPVTEIRMRRG